MGKSLAFPALGNGVEYSIMLVVVECVKLNSLMVNLLKFNFDGMRRM